MTPIRIRIVAIALSVSCGFAGAAGSTPGSAQNATGTPASKRMADGKEWTTANLNVNASPSYCYDDAEPNCRRYGRLYTQYARLEAHGFYWTASDNDPGSAPFYNFGNVLTVATIALTWIFGRQKRELVRG